MDFLCSEENMYIHGQVIGSQWRVGDVSPARNVFVITSRVDIRIRHMKKYDDIVVGSGISGMTLALLLGLNGHSVLLLEKSSHIGGSMARFYREKIPFDTGFHFTGGFSQGTACSRRC